MDWIDGYKSRRTEAQVALQAVQASQRVFVGANCGEPRTLDDALTGERGKPIIALPSTAKELSRIVPTLAEGAGVVTSRGDVHYVVTEFGVADLHGKSVRQRCKALISIAHPSFQEQLSRFARQYRYLRPFD